MSKHAWIEIKPQAPTTEVSRISSFEWYYILSAPLVAEWSEWANSTQVPADILNGQNFAPIQIWCKIVPPKHIYLKIFIFSAA